VPDTGQSSRTLTILRKARADAATERRRADGGRRGDLVSPIRQLPDREPTNRGIRMGLGGGVFAVAGVKLPRTMPGERRAVAGRIIANEAEARAPLPPHLPAPTPAAAEPLSRDVGERDTKGLPERAEFRERSEIRIERYPVPVIGALSSPAILRSILCRRVETRKPASSMKVARARSQREATDRFVIVACARVSVR